MPGRSTRPARDDHHVAALRRFNRLYTRRIGALDEGHLHSAFSLAEVRVLYEIAHRPEVTAAELGRALSLDAGYLSRMLRRLEGRALLRRRRSPADARRTLLSLTPRGRATFARLDARASNEIRALLDPLPHHDRERLVRAARTIGRLLGDDPADVAAPDDARITLRRHRPGDMGWVVQRHGALYAREYGWDARFEALVAEIAADFLKHHDPARERAWIAERDGEPVGSVFLVRKTDEVAKLRLLLVEPTARGLGVGSRLVDECVRFARHAGYRAITLWTNDVLVAARRIYERAGFRLVHAEPHAMFGPPSVGETWELALDTPPARPRGRVRIARRAGR